MTKEQRYLPDREARTQAQNWLPMISTMTILTCCACNAAKPAWATTSPTAKRDETLNAMTGQYEEGLARTLAPLAKSDCVDRRLFSKEDQRYFLLKSKVINMIRRAEYGKMIHYFTRFDRSMKGAVDLDNFLQVLQQAGIRMSRDDGKRFFNDFKVEQEKVDFVQGQKNLLITTRSLTLLSRQDSITQW